MGMSAVLDLTLGWEVGAGIGSVAALVVRRDDRSPTPAAGSGLDGHTTSAPPAGGTHMCQIGWVGVGVSSIRTIPSCAAADTMSSG